MVVRLLAAGKKKLWNGKRRLLSLHAVFFYRNVRKNAKFVQENLNKLQ